MLKLIGSAKEEPVDIRIICATNRNLRSMVEENRFRADLFYRINQFSIDIPPLRECGEDVIMLAYMILNRYRLQYPEREIKDFHPDAPRYIGNHNWPGNIIELSNTILRAVLTSQSPYINFDIGIKGENTSAINFEEATRRFQKEFLEKAIREAGGNKELAAGNTGLSRSTFYRYLNQLKI